MGRTKGLRGYNKGKGWSAALTKALKDYADQLVRYGPGKKPDGIRGHQPKREVSLSSDYMDLVFAS